MKNTIRGTLALAFVMVSGCGDDGGDDSGGGGDLTLEEALETSGTDSSEERAELVFPAACEEQVKCDPDPQCAQKALSMFESMRSGRSNACLDTTLDLFACFATTPCAEYDTDDRCNELGDKQEEDCK